VAPRAPGGTKGSGWHRGLGAAPRARGGTEGSGRQDGFIQPSGSSGQKVHDQLQGLMAKIVFLINQHWKVLEGARTQREDIHPLLHFLVINHGGKINECVTEQRRVWGLQLTQSSLAVDSFLLLGSFDCVPSALWTAFRERELLAKKARAACKRFM